MEIWGDKAPDAASDTWYVNSGESMSMCLSTASKKRAYCLSDNATYLSYRDSLALKPLLENGEDMQDVYSLIDVNPKKVDGVNSEGAKALIEWMFGEEASNLIARYGETTYGAPLYTLFGQ
jgi:tungstate transport system substrate-binding protein